MSDGFNDPVSIAIMFQGCTYLKTADHRVVAPEVRISTVDERLQNVSLKGMSLEKLTVAQWVKKFHAALIEALKG